MNSKLRLLFITLLLVNGHFMKAQETIKHFDKIEKKWNAKPEQIDSLIRISDKYLGNVHVEEHGEVIWKVQQPDRKIEVRIVRKEATIQLKANVPSGDNDVKHLSEKIDHLLFPKKK